MYTIQCIHTIHACIKYLHIYNQGCCTTPYFQNDTVYTVRCTPCSSFYRIIRYEQKYGVKPYSSVPPYRHRTACMITCMRHQKQVTLQVILINTFISLTSSHRWTSPAPLQSAQEWAWGEAPFPPPEPAPFPKHPSRPPSQQFAEVVVGSSVQEDSDDEEGQDEQQQVESVSSQQQCQQDKVKWCCKHCQRVLSGKNDDRMKKHLLNPRACKFLDSSAAADCTAKEIAQPARKKTDCTVHCTVSYRIYGVKNTVKTVLTVPYCITVHRTATALYTIHAYIKYMNIHMFPYLLVLLCV